MPLQIRRGTAAERNAISTPLVIGELLYVTDDGKLYIGDGTSLGGNDLFGNPGEGGKGLVITGFTSEEAQDATAALFSNGTHTNITFTYNDSTDSLSAAVDLTSYTGLIGADVKGSIFAQDSTLLVDAVSGNIPYSVLSGAPTNLSSFTNDVGYIKVSDIADGTVTIDVNNTGDLQGSVYGDDSTLLVDATNSLIPYSVLSGAPTNLSSFTNDVGYIKVSDIADGTVTIDVNNTGDLQGSVYGDDSTLLVDATNSLIPSSVISGTITNDIESSLVAVGTLTGIGSSTVEINTTARFTSDVIVENEFVGNTGTILELNVPNIFNLANITTESSVGTAIRSRTQNTSIRIVNELDNGVPPTLTLIKQRGPDSSVNNANNFDSLGLVNFVGYNSGSYQTGAQISAQGPIFTSASNLPSKMIFSAQDGSGNLKPIASMTSDGFYVTTDSYSFIANLAAFDQFHDTVDAKNVQFRRGRGSSTSPAVVQPGDDIIDLGFAGYVGATSNLTVGAGINVVVDGPIADTGLIGQGILPTKIVFTTQADSGGLQERMIINKTGLVQFNYGLTNNEILIDNNKISTTNSNSDLELDPAGTGTVDFIVAEQSGVGAAGGASALPASPSTYFKIKVNGTTYVVPAFAVS